MKPNLKQKVNEELKWFDYTKIEFMPTVFQFFLEALKHRPRKVPVMATSKCCPGAQPLSLDIKPIKGDTVRYVFQKVWGFN